MAIDYILCRPCPIKAEYGDKGLIQLVQKHSMALGLLNRCLDDGMSHEEAVEQKVSIPITRQNGQPGTRKAQLLDLLAETQVLNKYRQHCKDCPLARGYDFGCYQILPYPISAKTEELLSEMARQARKKGAPFNRLIHYIKERNQSGEPFTSLRKHPVEDFLEREESIPIASNLGVITTDQILQAFFAHSPLDETHIAYILFFSGFLSIEDQAPPEDSYDQAVKIRNSDGKVDYWILKLPHDNKDDKSYTALLRFIEGLFLAFATKVPVQVEA